MSTGQRWKVGSMAGLVWLAALAIVLQAAGPGSLQWVAVGMFLISSLAITYSLCEHSSEAQKKMEDLRSQKKTAKAVKSTLKKLRR